MPWTTCGACGEAAFISEADAEAGAEAYCSPECADPRPVVTTNYDPIAEMRTIGVEHAGQVWEYRRAALCHPDGSMQLEYRRIDVPAGSEAPPGPWFPVPQRRLAWLEHNHPRTLRFLVPEADAEREEQS